MTPRIGQRGDPVDPVGITSRVLRLQQEPLAAEAEQELPWDGVHDRLNDAEVAVEDADGVVLAFQVERDLGDRLGSKARIAEVCSRLL